MRKHLLSRLRSFEFRRDGKVDKKNRRLLSLDTWLVPFLVAVLVGVCVGILAKSHQGILACFSLLPSSIVAIAFRRLNFTNFLLMVLLVAVEMLVGAAVAKLTFRTRRRTMQVAQ